MKRVKIVRTDTNPDTGTFGILSVNGVPLCNTLELFWRNNMRNVSCIQSGIYHCVRHESRVDDWRVLDVPNRSGILFHAGNTVDDIEGCILFGEQIAPINGLIGLIGSNNARAKFNMVIDGDEEFTLDIINSF